MLLLVCRSFWLPFAAAAASVVAVAICWLLVAGWLVIAAVAAGQTAGVFGPVRVRERERERAREAAIASLMLVMRISNSNSSSGYVIINCSCSKGQGAEEVEEEGAQGLGIRG